MSRTATWHVRWHREWPGRLPAAARSHWEEVVEADPHAHPFFLPEVVRLWGETVGRETGARPWLGTAEAADGRRAVLPWAVVRSEGRLLRRRRLVSAVGSLAGYEDPLLAPRSRETPTTGGPPTGRPITEEEPADIGELWTRARRDLSRYHDQALFHLLRRPSVPVPESESESAAAGGSALTLLPDEESPVLDLRPFGDLDDALAACSANHRGDVRRRLRRIEEAGRTELWVAGPREAAAAAEDFENAFLPAYAAVWEGHSAGSLLDRPGVTAFVRGLVREGIAAGWAHYACLRLDGRSIAWHLGLVHRGLAQRRRLYWWFPTYDPGEGSRAPGKVLLALLIERLLAEGFTHLHFLTGSQPYKDAWRPSSERLTAVAWHAPSFRGRALAAYDRWRSTPRSSGETSP